MAVLGLAILAMLGAVAFEAALENAGTDVTVANETFTPTADTVIQLDDSGKDLAYYSHNVTVYDENDTVMNPGSDYTWFTGNGTIKPLSGGALAGDTTAKITYAYQLTTQEQQELAALAGELPRAIGLMFPALALIVLFAMLNGGG